MTAEDWTLLSKAAADPKGQIALKRSRCGGWPSERDRLAALASHGHLSGLGEIMGPQLGGTFALWRITPVGRALAETVGCVTQEGGETWAGSTVIRMTGVQGFEPWTR